MIVFFLNGLMATTKTENFCICECFRTMHSSRSIEEISKEQKISPPFHPQHCCAVFAKGDRLIDSRGFYNTGPQKEPAEKIELSKCSAVRVYGDNKTTAVSDWTKYTENFDHEVTYSATEMNCCTKVVDAFRNMYPDISLLSENVNFGIGTRYRVSKEALFKE